MGGDTLNLKIDSSIPFSLKRLHAKIVMHLVIFRWLCLRGFYGISRILVTYLSLFSRHVSFNSLCCQSASFHYGDERKDGTEKRAKTVLFIRGGHRYVHNHNICSRKIETASYAQFSFYGWSTAVVQGPFLDGTRDKNHDGLQISSPTSTMPWMYG